MNDPSHHPISGSELRQFLERVIPVSGEVNDASYLLTSRHWIETVFSDAWLTFKPVLGNFVDEETDCDDFARGAVFLSGVLHRNTTDRTMKTALAFGQFNYLKMSGEEMVGHAINFYVFRDSENDLNIGLYEPQTGQNAVLSQIEKDSCVSWSI